MSSWSVSILGESPTKFDPLELLTETINGHHCGSSPEIVSISLDEMTQNALPIGDLGQQEFKDGEEVVNKMELCQGIKYDDKLFVDVDTKIKVKKFDENENAAWYDKMENSSHISAVSVIECVMVHKPERCEANGNIPRESFLKGLFSTDSNSVPEKGIASYESSNSVDEDCYQGMNNSCYYTSFENDPFPIRQGDPRDESHQKLPVNRDTNDQEIMDIVNRDITDQEMAETANGNITNQDRMETVNRDSIDPEIMDNKVTGVPTSNSEIVSNSFNVDPEEFFENRFSDGFHNAMAMAVVDMHNEENLSTENWPNDAYESQEFGVVDMTRSKAFYLNNLQMGGLCHIQNEENLSTENWPNDAYESQEFGVPELSWRMGTICCDSIHTDVENHVASHQHEAKRFKCKDCNLKFSQSQLFLNHINNHHVLGSSSLKCLEDKCRLLFPTTFSLKIHQQEYHVQDDSRMRFKCSSCSKKRKEDRGDGKMDDRGESTGEVFVARIGEHALKVHRELWI